MQGVEHYENFPVASWLCPPALRPPIAAIYHYARTADDIADEGNAAPADRLADLAHYEVRLRAVHAAAQAARDGNDNGNGIGKAIGDGPTPRPDWDAVFAPLGRAIAQWAIPLPPLLDLLSAFAQDVRHSASGHRYADEAELLDYCRRSANPIGRLLLHLYGVHDAASLAQSDDICSALQLINFWQDLGVDLKRGRHYLPMDACAHHGIEPDALLGPMDAGQQARAATLVADLAGRARQRMLRGAALVHRLPGRAGWELRLVVQGGLRVLDRLQAMGHGSWAHRPRLGTTDLPALVWRAVRM